MDMSSMATTTTAMAMGMNMGMSTTTTAAGMSMATSTGMSSMSSSMASMMSSMSSMMTTTPAGDPMMLMSSMAMTFFTSTTTPLWSIGLTPSNAGQYAGLCIFLIVFASIFRLLLALRVNIYRILEGAERRKTGGLLGVDGEMMGDGKTEGKRRTTRPWRAREAVLVAALDVVVAGVSYLLMLAVMTMNVGYFLSILAGVFVGSLCCGRFTGSSGAH